MGKAKMALLISIAVSVWLLSSCSTYHLEVKGIAYQSIRAKNPIEKEKIPQNAKIIVAVMIDVYGNVDVEVQNNSDEIMTIDRTKTFFRGSDGNSTVYYDPTVNVLAQSTTSGHTTGASVNLGSVAKAVGVGGVAGTLLSGVNVGGANQNATTTTNTTYIVDQPKISIAPHGKASLGRTFQEAGFSVVQMALMAQNQLSDKNRTFDPDDSMGISCNITISYSVDGEQTYDKMETMLYVNSLIVSHVKQVGYVNEALREIYVAKGDLFDEDWYTLCFGGAPWYSSYDGSPTKTENYNAYKFCHHELYSFK